jgi:hypothetical protein
MNPDFSEMLSALSEAGADYMIVGAHALAAHGIPRATGDIDIWVRPSRENAARVLAALRAFGAPLFDLSEGDLERSGTVFQIGLVPNRIDILTAISGVTFEEAWPRKATFTIEGRALPFIAREDLERNKRAAGRPKDVADLLALRGQETD